MYDPVLPARAYLPVEEKWTLRYQASTGRLFIVAQGFATEGKSKEACAEFLRLIGEKKIDLVVDLERMTGYTSEARRAFQDCFYPVRDQIEHMYVVGRNVPLIVRMGATVVASFIGVPIRFFQSVEALDESQREHAKR